MSEWMNESSTRPYYTLYDEFSSPDGDYSCTNFTVIGKKEGTYWTWLLPNFAETYEGPEHTMETLDSICKKTSWSEEQPCSTYPDLFISSCTTNPKIQRWRWSTMTWFLVPEQKSLFD